MFYLNNTLKSNHNHEEIIIDFNNGSLALTEKERLEFFLYAKFVTQTYKYFQMISKNHINIELIEKFKISQIRKTNYYKKNTLEENKQIHETIKLTINNEQNCSPEQAKTLYLLNSIYSLKFFNLLSRIGNNNHEKSAFLFLAKRNYKDKILFNRDILRSENFIIKEFDALILRQNGHSEITLVEAKTKLTKDTFRQVFGYNNKGLKVSHKDILVDEELCALNGFTAQINRIEIIYDQVNENIFKNHALGKYLQKYTRRFSFDIPKSKFIELCREDIKYFKTEDYLLINSDNLLELSASQIEQITFTQLNSTELGIQNHCLNQDVLELYSYLFNPKK